MCVRAERLGLGLTSYSKEDVTESYTYIKVLKMKIEKMQRSETLDSSSLISIFNRILVAFLIKLKRLTRRTNDIPILICSKNLQFTNE